jgi:hypothetical protein
MILSLSAPEENSLNELVSESTLKQLLNYLPLKRTSNPLDTLCLKVKTEYEKLSEKAIKNCTTLLRMYMNMTSILWQL